MSFILQSTIIKVTKKNNIYDKYESRKLNKTPRARLGGIGIFSGFLISSWVFLVLKNSDLSGFQKIMKKSDISFFLIALSIVFIIGLLDDIFQLKALQKLPFEIIAATILYFKGFSISVLSNPIGTEKIVFSGFISYILTVLWIVAITNAMNLIDGIDGLAGGIAILAIISFSIISYFDYKIEFSLLSMGMIGSILAFLIYNYHPSKIYMGDSGSLTLGFFLGAISLKASTKASFGISFLIPVIILFIPIFDTVLAFTRRILKKKNPFSADNEHLHHKLLKKGLNERKTFFTLMVWTTGFSILGVASVFLSKTFRLIIFSIVFLSGFGVLFYLKYIEYGFLKKIIRRKNH